MINQIGTEFIEPKKHKIELVNPSQIHELRRNFLPTLFVDVIGEEIKAGDRVQFYLAGNIFPSNGTVSNLNKLQVDCFNNVLNKWDYYEVRL